MILMTAYAESAAGCWSWKLQQMIAGISHTHAVNDCNSWMLPMNPRRLTRNRQMVAGAGSCSRWLLESTTHML